MNTDESRHRNPTDLIPGGILGATKWPSPYDYVVERGAGARLWTRDGPTLIDYLLGSGPMVLGHAHPRVVAAIQEQASRGTQFYAMNDKALELADRIIALVPCAEAVKFVSDGSSATLYAMRFARAFTGRSKILKFEGAFHGSNDYALHGMTPAPELNSPFGRPASAGVPPEVSSTVLIAPFNDIEATRNVATAHAEDLAAIIVEPVQRSLMPKPGFLADLRALCDGTGALLIFDEVVTGFRLALGGAQQVFGVTPDLCSLGKIVGGGLPLAAVAGPRAILELADTGRKDDGKSVPIEGTLSGNPLAAAAGLATIDVLIEEDGPAQLANVGTELTRRFSDCAERLSIPFQMLGPPVFPEPIFDEGPVTDARSYNGINRAASRGFGLELLRENILLRVGSKLYVSLAHDEDVIDITAHTVFRAMQAVRDGGLIDAVRSSP